MSGKRFAKVVDGVVVAMQSDNAIPNEGFIEVPDGVDCRVGYSAALIDGNSPYRYGAHGYGVPSDTGRSE